MDGGSAECARPKRRCHHHRKAKVTPTQAAPAADTTVAPAVDTTAAPAADTAASLGLNVNAKKFMPTAVFEVVEDEDDEVREWDGGEEVVDVSDLGYQSGRGVGGPVTLVTWEPG